MQVRHAPYYIPLLDELASDKVCRPVGVLACMIFLSSSRSTSMHDILVGMLVVIFFLFSPNQNFVWHLTKW